MCLASLESFFGFGLSDKAMVEGPGNKLKGEKMKGTVVGQVLAVFWHLRRTILDPNLSKEIADYCRSKNFLLYFLRFPKKYHFPFWKGATIMT